MSFESLQKYQAGRHYTLEVSLDDLPLFVVEGASIPVSAPQSGAVARYDDPISELLRF